MFRKLLLTERERAKSLASVPTCVLAFMMIKVHLAGHPVNGQIWKQLLTQPPLLNIS